MAALDSAFRRWLVLTAGMGAGHDQAAGEIAERIRDRDGRALVLDVLDLLPAGIGHAIRTGYAWALRGAPWLYEAIFRAFFRDHRHQPGTFPLDVLAGRRLRPVIEALDPCAVVSTFHLAAQVVGRMRHRGQLAVPSIVVITEPAAHRLWVHPGTDLFVTFYPWVAAAARVRTGAATCAPGPLVAEDFHKPGDRDRGRQVMGVGVGEDAVLISTGSWGVGAAGDTVRALARLDRVRPVVLCGHNEVLRRQIARISGCTALGWREDLPDLFAGSAVLVDQSGGSTCAEAFAAGLPVVTHRPLPGHGRIGAAALAAAGLVEHAGDARALLDAVNRLRRPGPARETQLTRAGAVFAEDPAEALVRWVTDRGRSPRRQR